MVHFRESGFWRPQLSSFCSFPLPHRFWIGFQCRCVGRCGCMTICWTYFNLPFGTVTGRLPQNFLHRTISVFILDFFFQLQILKSNNKIIKQKKWQERTGSRTSNKSRILYVLFFCKFFLSNLIFGLKLWTLTSFFRAGQLVAVRVVMFVLHMFCSTDICPCKAACVKTLPAPCSACDAWLHPSA